MVVYIFISHLKEMQLQDCHQLSKGKEQTIWTLGEQTGAERENHGK